MEEIWRPVRDYEGLYEVSNYARVKSLPRNGTILQERIMRQVLVRGYLCISLMKNNIKKQYKVHRLVAQAFLDNPDNLPEVNHKDENKLNNIPENLEWCDRKYNNNYGTARKRGAEKISGANHYKARPILEMDLEGNVIREWGCMREAEKALNIPINSSIQKCLQGKYKTAYKRIWKFKEEDD